MGVTTDKDVEKIINGLEGFSLYDSFMDLEGHCDIGMSNTQDRKSLEEPHEESGQIYRLISYPGQDFHDFGYVSHKGDIKLKLSIGDGYVGVVTDSRGFTRALERYFALKNHLTENGVKYTPDEVLEKSITKYAAQLNNSNNNS